MSETPSMEEIREALDLLDWSSIGDWCVELKAENARLRQERDELQEELESVVEDSTLALRMANGRAGTATKQRDHVRTNLQSATLKCLDARAERDAAYALLRRWRDDAIFVNVRRLWCDACGHKGEGNDPDAIEHGRDCLYVDTSALLAGSPEEQEGAE